MPEIVNPGEMPTPVLPTEPVVEPQAPQTPEQLKAELANVQKALKEANAESAKRRKQLEAYETTEKVKKEAELSEMDKLRNQLAETEARAKLYERQQAQRTAAEKIGLPAAFADRLKGETPEELEADAKSILELMPKTKSASPGSFNPGINNMPTETRAQKKARLTGLPDGQIFDKGGGVIWPNQE